MSGKSNVTDTGNPKLDKCEQDLVVDSGFLSEEIKSEEIEADYRPSGRIDADDDDVAADKMLKESNVCVESGVCLSEDFSNLSLRNPDLNDLSCTKQQQPLVVGDALQPEGDQNVLWSHCFEQDEDGDTYLHITIACGRKDLVKKLLQLVPHHLLLDTPNDDGQTPLHVAIERNQYLMARWLVIAGASKSPRDVRGESPLHIACRNGDMRCVSALLEPVKHEERQAMKLTCQPPPIHNQMVDLEQWNYAGQTCVHVAAINGHLEVLRNLYWYGADINAQEGRGGYTALHYAVERGDEQMVKFLLSCKKLDVNATTYGQRSALQITASVPAPLSALLLDMGCSPYNSDDEDDYESMDESEDEMVFNRPFYVPNMVGTNA